MKIRKMSRQEWDILPKLIFQNVCLDFSIEVGILKVINQGKFKVAVTVGTSPEWIDYETKIAMREEDNLWLHYGGSPCNNYFKRAMA